MTILDTILGALLPATPALQVSMAVEPDAVIDPDYAAAKMLGKLDSPTAQKLFQLVRGGVPARRGSAEMMLAYSRLPSLRTVVGLVATKTSVVKMRVYRVKPGARRTRKHFDGDFLERKARRETALKAGEIEEVPGHALALLMERWNPEMSGTAGRKVSQIHRELKGDQFIIIERRGPNQDGEPYELWPIPPYAVILPRTADGPFEVQWRGVRLVVPRERMLYMRDLDPFDPIGRGAGIGDAVSDEVDTDEFSAKYLKTWFANHGMPAMLIGVEGAEGDQIKITAEAFREKNQGVGRNGRVHFHNGALTAVRLDDNFNDMEMVQLRGFLADTVRMGWNVSPESIGNVDSSNKASSLVAEQNLAKNVVAPRIETWRQELNAQLVPLFDDGEFLFIDFDDPVPPDFAERLEAQKVAPFAVSMNESRDLAGLPHDVELDGKFLVDNRVMMFTGGVMREFAPIETLTTGIERLLAVGDIDAANALRVELGQRVGANLSPIIDDPGAAPTAPAPKQLRAFVAKGLSASAINAIVAACDPADFTDEVMPVERVIVDSNGEWMSAELAAPSKAYDPMSEQVAQYLSGKATKRVKNVSTTTKGRLRNVLLQAQADGLTVDETADVVRSTFRSFKGARADLIARTETTASGNFGRMSALVQSGQEKKKWHTTLDGREREAHRAMHGQVVPVGNAFRAPSGAYAMHPGGFASAALSCNCRCIVVPEHYGEEQAQATIVLFDRQNAPLEVNMHDAAVRGFDKQERKVLVKLSQYR